MNWTITFYNKKVEKQTLSFPSGILANLTHILELIEELGPIVRTVYVDTYIDIIY